MRCIFFFGSNNFAWIENHNVKDYEENKDVCLKAAKTVPFKEACAAIEAYKLKLSTGEIAEDDELGEEEKETLVDDAVDMEEGKEEQAEADKKPVVRTLEQTLSS